MTCLPERRSRILFFALLAFAVAAGGCRACPARVNPDASPFDRLGEKSWVIAEPARTFLPANLYEEIDGESELFLSFAFRELAVGILAPAGRLNDQIRMELFFFGSQRDAFGIWSQHRFPGQEVAAAGGAEAIISDTSVDFFKGTSFARIRGVSPGVTRADLLSLWRDAAGILTGSSAPPGETEVLSLPGLVAGSVVFQPRALLGYEGLAPGYEAKIDSAGIGVTVVLIPPDGSQRNSGSLTRGMQEVAALDEGLLRARLPAGTLWLASKGGYHYGVAGKLSFEQARAVLAGLSARLGRFLDGKPPGDGR